MSQSAFRRSTFTKGTLPRCGIARALSKLGACSRSQATDFIRAGRVTVNGVIRRDPEFPVQLTRDRLHLDGQPVAKRSHVYLMLNKPRGLVTTTSDEKGRSTVYECLAGQNLPFLGPVGRLDQASEGLLLFTNDTAWADSLTNPASHLDKCYHVQVNQPFMAEWKHQAEAGVVVEGERFHAKRFNLLRSGQKNTWLEIILDEGRNRQIRKLLAALGLEVLRLVRVSIGSLELGTLAKGQVRTLTDQEVRALASGAKSRR